MPNIVVLTTLWIYSLSSPGLAQSQVCTLIAWLARHPSDSTFRFVSSDSLDHKPQSLGWVRPMSAPPDQTLRGIGAEVVVATTIDSAGNVISTGSQSTSISRYQGGVSPEEVRRWSPVFDTAAVRYVRGQRYSPPLINGTPVAAFTCFTVRYSPIPNDKKFDVAVSAEP